MERPIVIASSGQRCGSTLLQRLISSHPDAFVWGEHGGRLRELRVLREHLSAWTRVPGTEPDAAVGPGGHQTFMAMASPGPATVDAAARAFVATLFAPPPGCARWGFKEVHYAGAEVGFVLELFPGARVVHVTRDPRTVLASLDAWERGPHPWNRGSTEAALRDWVRVNAELPALGAPAVLTVRYEDLVADPDAALVALGDHLELDAAGFDREVFALRLHGAGADGGGPRSLRAFAALDPELRELLDDAELRAVAARMGYVL